MRHAKSFAIGRLRRLLPIYLLVVSSCVDLAGQSLRPDLEKVSKERSATVISVGDKAYVWTRGDIVFIKGKFTFWLSGGLDLRVGDFTNNAAYMEKWAREIADAVAAD